MIFHGTHIEGVKLIELEPIADDRGSFSRSFCSKTFEAQGLNPAAVQMSIQSSLRAGTIRGMHRQRDPYAEDKLVRCIQGAIFDVALDVRPDSPTYLQWFGAELSAANRLSLVVPKGCAHGLQVLEEDTQVLYVMSEPFVEGSGIGFRWDDPAFGIQWPITENIHAADRDRSWPLVSETERRS